MLRRQRDVWSRVTRPRRKKKKRIALRQFHSPWKSDGASWLNQTLELLRPDGSGGEGKFFLINRQLDQEEVRRIRED